MGTQYACAVRGTRDGWARCVQWRGIPVDKRGKKRPPVLLSVRYHIETGNLIFSRHIKVHSLPADRDHYSLSVTTRHADYVAKSLLLILFRRLRRLEERKVGGKKGGCYPFLEGSRWIYAFCRGNDGNVYSSMELKFDCWKMLRGRERERDFWMINNTHTYSWYTRISFIYVFEKFSGKNRTDTSNFCNPNYRDSTIGPKKIESSVSSMDSFQLNSTFEHSVACSNLH